MSFDSYLNNKKCAKLLCSGFCREIYQHKKHTICDVIDIVVAYHLMATKANIKLHESCFMKNENDINSSGHRFQINNLCDLKGNIGLLTFIMNE